MPRAKIPHLLIVGARETADGTVTLRRHGVREQTTMPLAAFEAALARAIATRALNSRCRKRPRILLRPTAATF